MNFVDPNKIPTVGHPRIDAMHRALAEQANALYDRWRADPAAPGLTDGLALLVRAVGRHFAEEETITAAAGYGGWSAHAAEHARLLAVLDGVYARQLEPPGPDGENRFVDVLHAIEALLYDHEVLDDQDYWTLFSTPVPQPTGPVLIAPTDLPLTGQAEVDAQHQELAGLVNHLYAAVLADAPPQDCERLLEALFQHTTRHFALEDALMARQATPLSAPHRMLHEDLLHELTAAVEKWRAGGYHGLEDVLANYLKYWLIDHISHVDPWLNRPTGGAGP